MKPAPFKSEFMLLDVKNGRAALAKRLLAGEKVDVWIKATLQNHPSSIGNDDGVSIEFAADVQSVKVAGNGSSNGARVASSCSTWCRVTAAVGRGSCTRRTAPRAGASNASSVKNR